LSGIFVKIVFRMQIGDLVDSTIMQLYPLDFAKTLYETFIGNQEAGPVSEATPEAAMPAMEALAPPPMPAMPEMPPMPAAPPMPEMPMASAQPMPPMQDPYGGMQMMPSPPYGGMQMPQMQMQMMPQMMPQPGVNIQQAQFSTFNPDLSAVAGSENIDLIMDVPLEVTVELGRCVKSISDILEFAPGTIIELDKIAGEPIDVLVNGKFVAKGEVVVIEESFGVRVTEIIK